MVDRSQIRQQMRQQRNALSLQRRSDAADDVAQLINRSRFYRHSQRIACYMANDNELSLEPLIERIWRAGKCCYLPVLDSIHRNRLCFAAYRPDSIMRLNRFGIPEPLYKKGELIRARWLPSIKQVIALVWVVGFMPVALPFFYTGTIGISLVYVESDTSSNK